jgi:hypothetical protein
MWSPEPTQKNGAHPKSHTSRKKRHIKIKMKTLTVTVFIVVFSAVGLGQSRENRIELEFEKSSRILSESTGWYFNQSTGEWVENKNFISDKHYDSQGSLLSFMNQNFITLETKVVNHKGKNIYILIVQKWSGRWKYPSIRQDWQAYKTYNLFFFDEPEWMRLCSLEGNLILKCSHETSLSTDGEISIEDAVQNIIQNYYAKYPCEYVFSILKSDEGQIRFYLPYKDSKYNREYPVNYGDEYDFENSYFETTPENFSKIYSFDD